MKNYRLGYNYLFQAKDSFDISDNKPTQVPSYGTEEMIFIDIETEYKELSKL